MSVECQVHIKSQSEIDIGGRETCIVLQEYVNEDKSDTLDDVIAKMKNSLKAIKDGMNTKALIDINREFTPLDLPPLSPIPFR